MDNQDNWGGLDVKKEDPKSEAYKRELYRSSMDTIRVANTTDEDFVTDWDGNKWKVPAHGERSMPRYVAIKYCRDLKDKIINKMNDDKVASEVEKRRKAGMHEMTSYEKQELYDRCPRTDNADLIKEIYSKVWLGVEEEYGNDIAPMDNNNGRIETKTVEEQVLETMNKRYVPEAKEEMKKSILKEPKDDEN